MTTGQPVKIRLMKKGDLPAAYFLSKAEGWNQTVDDWAFLFENPDNVCIVAEKDLMVAGTATVLIHSGKIAWIGMVLVDQSCRGMGIGRELMNGIINRLPANCSTGLDATPAGKPLYEKLGFRSEYSLMRMTNQGVSTSSADREIPIDRMDIESLTAVTQADATIIGVGRKKLLAYLYNNAPERSFIVRDSGRIKGYFMGRKGVRFNYAGPLCADSFEIAGYLLTETLKSLKGRPVAVDVLADKKEFIDLLEQHGFVKQREFTRMYLNENQYPGIPEYQYLISGPEFG